jgi:hypothetical protein
LGWDPNLGVWLRDQDISLPSISAAREFARQYKKWRFGTDRLINRGWLTRDDHLKWQTEYNPFILDEINELFDLMEDDRDRFLGEINSQADGLSAYVVSFLGIDGERRPWTIELIRCGLAIGNILYMNYKQHFRRVRPSTIAPGLVPPFGPPRHPSFPSGHSFLGHFIALLLLEIPQIEVRFGEPTTPGVPPNGGAGAVEPVGPLIKPKLKGCDEHDLPVHRAAAVAGRPACQEQGARRCALSLRLVGQPLARRSNLVAADDGAGSEPGASHIAAQSDAVVPDATPPTAAAGPDSVLNRHLIDCPTFRRVLNLARSEWIVG